MSSSVTRLSQIHNANDVTPAQWFNIILNDGALNHLDEKEEFMTDKQYDGILHMIEMILDGCGNIEEAKEKIGELRLGHSDKPSEPSKSETN